MTNFSNLANTLIPSEIIKLGNQINEKIKNGETIYNFTIGDFDSKYFPIPALLESEIIEAYKQKITNYPPANGLYELRKSLASYIKRKLNLEYSIDSFLIASGGRPLIYTAYRAICDEDDKIIYSIPSWNNNHYTHFIKGKHICIETDPINNFLPTADQIIPLLKNATLLALCSPQNPTGTIYTREQLSKICEAVLIENNNRNTTQKKLYILFDQIYWTQTHNDTNHYNPVSLYPDLAPYTLFIDGISKSFCATGVRVGWAFGPTTLIEKMKMILGHIGAWSPIAEQTATAKFLNNENSVDEFLNQTNKKIALRLQLIYDGIIKMKNDGYPVDAIMPQAAIYLAIKFSFKNKKNNEGKLIANTQDMTDYILTNASLAIVPFVAFGADKESEWYRLSVGTISLEEIPMMFSSLRNALEIFKN